MANLGTNLRTPTVLGNDRCMWERTELSCRTIMRLWGGPSTKGLEEKKSALDFNGKLGASTKGSGSYYKHINWAFSVYLGLTNRTYLHKTSISMPGPNCVYLRFSYISPIWSLALKIHIPLPHFSRRFILMNILDKLNSNPVSSRVIFQPLPPSFHPKRTQTIFHDFHLWKQRDVWSGVKSDDSAVEKSTSVSFVSTFSFPVCVTSLSDQNTDRQWCQVVNAHCLAVESRPQGSGRRGWDRIRPREPTETPLPIRALRAKAPPAHVPRNKWQGRTSVQKRTLAHYLKEHPTTRILSFKLSMGQINLLRCS